MTSRHFRENLKNILPFGVRLISDCFPEFKIQMDLIHKTLISGLILNPTKVGVIIQYPVLQTFAHFGRGKAVNNPLLPKEGAAIIIFHCDN